MNKEVKSMGTRQNGLDYKKGGSIVNDEPNIENHKKISLYVSFSKR
jgi:hypothetical protein